MSDTINEEIAFIQFNEPPLKSGEYTLKLDQQVTVPNKKGSTSNTTETYSQTRHFYVAGDRFSIKPQEIHSQFPPPGNDGDHSNVLPHIILTRSTLPWERDADTHDSELPWLWLFIYDEDDLAKGHVEKPQQLAVNSQVCFLDPGTGKPLPNQTNEHGVQLEAEPQENLSEQVKVLKVNQQWLKSVNIIPTAAALKLLTSVRKNTLADNMNEWAICVANRMPMAGGKSYAHLVTLENRFNQGTFNFDNDLDAQGNISFVSLANWSFSCPDDISYQCTPNAISKLEKKGIPQVIINDIKKIPADALYQSTETFKSVLIASIEQANQSNFEKNEALILQYLQAPTATFKGLLDQVNRGNLQKTLLTSDSRSISVANQYIQRGSVALTHQLRHGGQTVSWYHGPFVDGNDPDAIGSDDIPISLPISASDQLLRFDHQLGMFDVSYAAAWELGRLLMLNNRTLAMQLYAWKRQHAWNLKQKEQGLLYDHLPFSDTNAGDKANADHGKKLNNWFNDLNLLHYVPFNYLVAQETLLPNESIRFFTLDNLWVECLMDGAFSIGRVTEGDCTRDRAVADIASAQYPHISGFLLRSEVVSGWPGLQVNGSSMTLTETQMPEHNAPLTILRMDTLAPDLLLCLFDGSIKTIDVHLKPESLHFGFDRPFENHTHFYKELKKLATGEITSPLQTVDISWLNQVGRIVDIETLNNDMSRALTQSSSTFTSAQFALEMIEGIPRIRFLVSA